jgi:hypothetical protein
MKVAARKHLFHRVVVASMAVLSALPLLVGCANGSAHFRQSLHAGSSRPSPEDIIAQSWATNGTQGYFIDLTSPPGSSMSLYDTAWWPLALGGDRRAREDLNSRLVASWVLPILYGSPGSNGLADTAGMPTLAVLENAVDLTTTLGIGFDKAVVARRFEALRVGNEYKSDASAQAGDWGSTALAVGLLQKLGMKPPAAVTTAIDAQLEESLGSRQASQLFGYVIPMLSLMSGDQVKSAARQVRAQLAWITTQLPSMTPFERLVAATDLRHVIMLAGNRPWSQVIACRGLQTSSQGVTIVANSAVDPQATTDALEAGCLQKVNVPPWTSSGWPNEEAYSDAVPASIAGIRIADALGASSQYRSLLVAQLENVWLPAPPGNAQPDVAGVAMLSRILGVKTASANLGGALKAALAAGPTAESLPVLLEAWIQGNRDNSLGRDVTENGATGNIFAAAASELEYRITGDRRFDDMSRVILARLAAGRGLYAVAEDAGPALARSSVVATAIADWILRVPMPVGALKLAGLCDQQLSCGQPGGMNSPLDSTLNATSAVLTMMHPDAVTFPMGF